jgi:protein-tyrosine-phosphatase
VRCTGRGDRWWGLGDLLGAVLFACSRNAVRSTMAEAVLKHLVGCRIYVESGGVRLGDADSFSVTVTGERLV